MAPDLIRFTGGPLDGARMDLDDDELWPPPARMKVTITDDGRFNIGGSNSPIVGPPCYCRANHSALPDEVRGARLVRGADYVWTES